MSSTKDDGCIISLEASNHSRRCFMTGEYCSQQRNVQQQREKLHKDRKIMAFVVMNFSDMSEVVYKWRICKYVESLHEYFYINNKKNELYCSGEDKDDITEDANWKQVKAIQVIRADSDPSSNYVICNRICQQMQMADLVVVDVSRQNPNVFYEFGMAVSLGKMILPICYSESYFNMELPEGLREKKEFETLRKHIGCYPWRKSLFEYYGICYKERVDKGKSQDQTKYIEYEQATSEENRFSDLQYSRFPYNEDLNEKQEKSGQVIYKKLQNSFKKADSDHNTLVVYTMEKFMNEEDSGKCIANFYNNITKKMGEEQCFCGERVGVLVQGNYILEDDKDTKKQSNLLYGIGEIIQIGLNQATYQAAERKIKTKDVLELKHIPKPSEGEDRKKQISQGKKNIIKCVKEYVRNRGLLVYPNTPLFVNRANNKFYGDLFDENKYPIFNLYYVMLKTLRYTNQIIVDISNNYEKCLQALFWLGAAHGSDVYAITVLHEETKEEKEQADDNQEKKARNIFDVAGLWMAILRSNDIEGFYKQLELAQQGVEHHSRLVLPDRKRYDDMILEEFNEHQKMRFIEVAKKLYEEKENREYQAMESYYRNRFWANMLRYNKLHIYLPQENGETPKGEPKAYMVRWDFDAVSELSNYLSKRKPIGEYRIIAMEKKIQEENKKRNFISVGEKAIPLGEQMACYINGKPKVTYSKKDIYWKEDFSTEQCSREETQEHRTYKGFKGIKNAQKVICSQHFHMKCIDCKTPKHGKTGVITRADELKELECSLKYGVEHTEIAQVILWREDSGNGDSFFYVSIIGSSGPASLAATMIFVDEEQKQRYLKDRKNEEIKEEYLVKLQELVRKQFMCKLIERVEPKVRDLLFSKKGDMSEEDVLEIEIYCYLLKCAITAYLSTVLYRYFLPFLSERDIKKIHNGMFAFMDYMKNGGKSPFALNYIDPVTREKSVISNENVEGIIEIVSEELLNVLKAFKGLEVFYTVMVKNGEQSEEKKDDRSIQKIQLYSKKGEKKINCIFEFDENTSCAEKTVE